MKPGRLLLLLLLIIILCLLWARYIEPERLVIKRVDIPSAKWPAGAGELRVLQISDLHLPSMSEKLRDKVVQAAVAEKPDLILVTGDFFSQAGVLEPGRTADLDRELEGISAFLSRFQAPLGIWTIRGNHDMANDKEVGDSLVNRLRRQGINVWPTSMPRWP